MTPLAERILDAFPSGTYGLSALLRLVDVVETDRVETAAVECRAQPRLLVNRAFVDAWAATPEKLLMLVMHELHHVLLGHTRLFPCATAVDNLVFDAVINALLCRMFPAPEHTAFFTDYYDDRSFPGCLLRPPAGWTAEGAVPLPPALAGSAPPELREVYRALYSPKGVGYDELYEVLRRSVPAGLAFAVALLGDHRGTGDEPGSAAGDLERRSPLLIEAVRRIVERWPQPPDPVRGRSLADLLRNEEARPVRRPSNRSLLAALLRRVGGSTRRGTSWRIRDDAIAVMTPLPTLDRRSTVLAALGAPPLLHAGRCAVPRRRRSGERVHVYVDVSGSVGDLRGALYGAVLDCQDLVHLTIHLFSTAVADVSLRDLRAGVCRTTGGTDIGCVAGHARGHRVSRAVIITDGYVGRPAGAYQETLAGIVLGVALTPGDTTRDDLAEVADHWAELSPPEE